MQNPNMLSPLEAMSYVQQQGDIGKQNQLAQLASQAYTTPQDQQNQLLGKMAAISPQAAQAQQTQFQSQQQDHNKTLANMAHMLVLSPQEAKAGLYQQMVPSLQRMGLNVPAQYDATSADTIDKTAQAVYQTYNGQKPKDTPSDIRTLQMLQSDPALLKLDMERRQAAGMVPKTVKTAEGYGYSTPGVGIQLAPMISGQGGNAPTLPPGGGQQTIDHDAQLANQMIAAGIPADQVDRFIQSRVAQFSGGAGGGWADGAGGTPPIAQPYVAPPKPQQAPSGYRYDDNGNLAVIPGGPADKPGTAEKPLPVNAMKQLFDLQSELQGSDKTMAMTQKHLGRLEAGQLDVRPGAAVEAWMRNKSGYSDEKSRNLSEWNADQIEMVNDSLRLNKGVQTEGDAQRAIDALMQAHDAASLKQSIARLQAVNQRAINLRQQQITALYRNYGRDADGEPLQVPSRVPTGGSAAPGMTQPQAGSAPAGRSIVRSGTLPDGRKVVQYSDGTTDYGN